MHVRKDWGVRKQLNGEPSGLVCVLCDLGQESLGWWLNCEITWQYSKKNRVLKCQDSLIFMVPASGVAEQPQSSMDTCDLSMSSGDIRCSFHLDRSKHFLRSDKAKWDTAKNILVRSGGSPLCYPQQRTQTIKNTLQTAKYNFNQYDYHFGFVDIHVYGQPTPSLNWKVNSTCWLT